MKKFGKRIPAHSPEKFGKVWKQPALFAPPLPDDFAQKLTDTD